MDNCFFLRVFRIYSAKWRPITVRTNLSYTVNLTLPLNVSLMATLLPERKKRKHLHVAPRLLPVIFEIMICTIKEIAFLQVPSISFTAPHYNTPWNPYPLPAVVFFPGRSQYPPNWVCFFPSVWPLRSRSRTLTSTAKQIEMTSGSEPDESYFANLFFLVTSKGRRALLHAPTTWDWWNV